VTVSASSTREALEKAKAAWRQGKIVLSPENFMSVEYDIFDGNLEDFNEGSLE
ncbi:MAG: hypothetical protein IJ702_03130, partial [Fretibacterium sp.]|nr:hypothetical protein [Fretibacterium sp.]